MKPTIPRILSFWGNDRERLATYSDLKNHLRVPGAHGNQLKEMLGRLVEQGVLSRKGHRFRLSDKAESPKRQSDARKKTVPPKGEKSRTSPPREAKRRSAPSPAEGFEGTFTANPSGFGFVSVPGRQEDIFIPGRYIGGALDGDRVKVEMLPPRADFRAAGRIASIVQRRRNRIRGRLHLDAGTLWLEPLSERMPMLLLPDVAPGKGVADGAFAEAEIALYPDNPDEAPEGRLIEVLKDKELDPSTLVDHILEDLDWPTAFSEATKSEMRNLPKDLNFALKGRKDLRKRLFVTIDGEDAKDFDDAVSLEVLPGGKRLLSVAIADVAAYVRPGTAVDDDAYARGTSVYFPRRVVPMLPKRLSNDLCSLKPGVPRLTLTCEMTLDDQGERVGYKIVESVIESRARLTYNQVLRFFENGKSGGMEPEVANMLTGMRTLAAQMRSRRSDRGSLDFTFPESRVELDKQGRPVRLQETFPTEATRLIEQFMLEANETVAEHCHTQRIPIPYRVHDPPPEEALPGLTAVLWNLGLPGKIKSMHEPGSVAELLRSLKDHPRRDQAELAILKSMSQARYRERNDGHFALAAEHYAHFTSPIRRYPDLLVHRALKASFQRGHKPGELAADTAFWLSGRERTAAEAETRVIRMYKVVYMEPRVGESFDASVSGITDGGAWIRLRNEAVDGMLPSRTFPGGRPRLDKHKQRWMLGGRHKTLQVGDPLQVRLASADRYTQRLEFELMDFGWAASGETRN